MKSIKHLIIFFLINTIILSNIPPVFAEKAYSVCLSPVVTINTPALKYNFSQLELGRLLETTQLNIEVNGFIRDLFGKNSKNFVNATFKGFKVDLISGRGYPVADEIVPFRLDDHGYVHLTESMAQLIQDHPDREEILFEIGVHYTLKLNYKVLAQHHPNSKHYTQHKFNLLLIRALPDNSERAIIGNYLPIISNGAIQPIDSLLGIRDYVGNDDVVSHHLALLFERYARRRRIGYRKPGSYEVVKGKETYMDYFYNTKHGLSFLSVPGKLSAFLMSLQINENNVSVGRYDISINDVNKNLRSNLAGENMLFAAGSLCMHNNMERYRIEATVPLLTNALGDFRNDPLVAGFLASVTGDFDMYFVRDLIEKFKGADLIQIVYQLQRLRRKVRNDSDKDWDLSESKQFHRTVEHVMRTYSKKNVSMILDSFEKLGDIYNLVNESYRPMHKVMPILIFMTELISRSEDPLREVIDPLHSFISTVSPAQILACLPLVEGTGTFGLARLQSLIQRFGKFNINIAALDIVPWMKLAYVEYILNHSSDPEHDLKHLNVYLRHQIVQRDRENLILDNMKKLYEIYDLRRAHHALFNNLDLQFTPGEIIAVANKKLTAGMERDGSYVPSIRNIRHDLDQRGNYNWNSERGDDIELLIYGLNHLNASDGTLIAFQKYEKILIQSLIALKFVVAQEELLLKLRDQLFQVMVRFLCLNNETVDPLILLGYLNTISEHMNYATAESLIKFLDKIVSNGDVAGLDRLLEELAYSADCMPAREAKAIIRQYISEVEEGGVQQTLTRLIALRVEYEQKRFPEEEQSISNMVAQIKGLPATDQKRLEDEIQTVLGHEKTIIKMSDSEIKKRVKALKIQVQRKEVLFEDVKLLYLAYIREIAKRKYGMRAYNIQLAAVLLFFYEGDFNKRGLVQEIKTGEGKSLIFALTNSLAALTGKPVDVFTVNTYLAARDAEQFKVLYNFLGLTVAYLKDNQDEGLVAVNEQSFAADIVYGTNSNFEYIYLLECISQQPIRAKDVAGKTKRREFAMAVVDEVDMLFLDEALNTHTIARPDNIFPTWPFKPIWKFFNELVLNIDYKAEGLTNRGKIKYSEFIGQLYKKEGKGKELLSESQLKRFAQSALIALRLRKNQDYVVKEAIKRRPERTIWSGKRKAQDEVIIVVQETGRKHFGSLWYDGIHQFVELKEGMKPSLMNRSIASITRPFYFSKYEKLFALTGTIGSETDAWELQKIYGVNSLCLPPHKHSKREDREDLILDTLEQKWTEVIQSIQAEHNKGRPVLVGVRTIEQSVKLHRKLEEETRIDAQLLNGEQGTPEAQIIKQAGLSGTVTIATNLAGRGTDILLGKGVEARAGLHVIGTERFRSRRIDDQLKGRAGRQGQPGSSQFIISLEDEAYRSYLDQEKLRKQQDHAKRKQAVQDVQEKLDVASFERRVRVFRICSIQDRQMTDFFNEIERLFNMKRIDKIFPEIIPEYNRPSLLGTDERASIFTIVEAGDVCFEGWIAHLQLLEELRKALEFESSETFESGLEIYQEQAEKSFKNVMNELREKVYLLYAELSGLDQVEVVKRGNDFEQTGVTPTQKPLIDGMELFQVENQIIAAMLEQAV
ncbi:MAG: hypothetical protein GY853_12975 [PVC group bacterium]|nr:hypothetical protein [PVC group bacterium]